MINRTIVVQLTTSNKLIFEAENIFVRLALEFG